jgi:hypothetical protein
MIYTIKIDRRTVKRNPTAGTTEYLIAGRSTCTLKVTHIMELPIDFKAHLVERNITDGIQQSVFVIREADFLEIFERLIKYGVPRENIKYNISRHHEHVSSMVPESNYIYQYLDCKVKCKYCNKKFSYKQLKSETSGWDDGVDSDTVCPKCGMFDCCVVNREELSDKELEKIAK